MKTAAVRQFTAAFDRDIASARVTGRFDGLHIALKMAALPLDAHFRVLCAIESAERAFRASERVAAEEDRASAGPACRYADGSVGHVHPNNGAAV